MIKQNIIYIHLKYHIYIWIYHIYMNISYINDNFTTVRVWQWWVSGGESCSLISRHCRALPASLHIPPSLLPTIPLPPPLPPSPLPPPPLRRWLAGASRAEALFTLICSWSYMSLSVNTTRGTLHALEIWVTSCVQPLTSDFYSIDIYIIYLGL